MQQANFATHSSVRLAWSCFTQLLSVITRSCDPNPSAAVFVVLCCCCFIPRCSPALLDKFVLFEQFGFIPWFSSSVVDIVGGLGLTWQPAFGIILVLYFYSHYFFASGEGCLGCRVLGLLGGAGV